MVPQHVIGTRAAGLTPVGGRQLGFWWSRPLEVSLSQCGAELRGEAPMPLAASHSCAFTLITRHPLSTALASVWKSEQLPLILQSSSGRMAVLDGAAWQDVEANCVSAIGSLLGVPSPCMRPPQLFLTQLPGFLLCDYVVVYEAHRLWYRKACKY